MTNVSSVVSHFPSAENGFTTTTSGSVSAGATSVGLNSVSGYTNGEVVVFIIDPTDATKKQTFTGSIDTGGVQVTNVVWIDGTNQEHQSGATVVDYADAGHISIMSKGMLVSHAQDGTLNDGAVDAAAVLAANVVTEAKILDGAVTAGKIASDAVTTAKILDANVTAGKLATDAVTTAKITDANVTADKIAADAVTAAKMINGQVLSRQGGSATVWDTAGTNTYDVSATDVKIQAGSVQGSAGSKVTVTFPTAYTYIPIVVAGTSTASGFTTFVAVSEKSNTSFKFECIDSGGSGRAEFINWIAIGV